MTLSLREREVERIVAAVEVAAVLNGTVGRNYSLLCRMRQQLRAARAHEAEIKTRKEKK